MRKKGFTLIELLAVIIILAIIALIATPIVLNVINDARKSAGLSETEMIMSGINNYCATSEIKNQLDGSVDICTDDDGVTIDDVSKMVSLGNAEVLEVKYENGKVAKLKVKSNNYEIELQPDGSFSVNGETTDPVDPTPEEPEGESLITTLLEQVGTKGLVQDETNSNIYYYVGGKDSYLDIKDYFWLGNRESSSDIRSVSDSGISSSVDRPSDAYGVRAVLYLKSGASALTFTGGNGTTQSLYELN